LDPRAKGDTPKHTPGDKARADVGEGDKRRREEEKPAGKRLATEEERIRLRARLEHAREKMLNRRPPRPAGDGAERDVEAAKQVELSPSPGYSASVVEEENLRERALELDPLEPNRPPAVPPKDPRKKPVEVEEPTKKKKKKDAGGPVRPREGSREVTKDGTLRTLQTQLVLKAQEIAQEKAQKEREEKKRHHRKDPSYKLAKILTLAVQGGRKRRGGSEGSGSSSGRHPKDQKKKKKKKRRGKPKRDGSDPSSPRGSSPTGSSGDSWGGASSGSTSSQKEKLTAPLKRRSKKKPGSVLQMLLQHARSQLDQSSKVGIGGEDSVSVVKGVKMGSYFAICVRPQNAMGQARELHHISQALDLLRQGELDSLGDVLAGRFMSVHQSVLDGTWTTARHLELMPLEDGTAAGPEVVLEAKRHARLAAKLASGDAWTWSSGSKGKGGRGRNSNWHEGGGDSKGKGKKGNKGKGKAKSWNSSEKDGDSKIKEKIPEK